MLPSRSGSPSGAELWFPFSPTAWCGVVSARRIARCQHLCGVDGVDLGSAKLADDFPGRAQPGDRVLEQVLHQDDVALHAGYFRDFDHLAGAVGKTAELNDQIERRGNVLAHRAL